jgi:hypothetical protein
MTRGSVFIAVFAAAFRGLGAPAPALAGEVRSTYRAVAKRRRAGGKGAVRNFARIFAIPPFASPGLRPGSALPPVNGGQMKGGRFFAAIAFIAAVCGLGALAPAAEQASIAVTGSVERMCILNAPQFNSSASTNIASSSGSEVRIANLSNDDMTTQATRFTAQLAAMCNVSHLLTVTSDRGGLWRDPAGAAPDGFANAVPYRAKISWNGSQETLSANAQSEGEAAQSLAIDQPGTGDIDIEFSIDQGATNAGTGAPLLAGSYNDTLRVTMVPQ